MSSSSVSKTSLVLGCSASLILGGLICLYVFQKKLIYIAGFPPGSRTHVWTPSQFGMTNWKEVWLETADNVKLHSYCISNNGAKSTVIFFQANAGNIGHRLPVIQKVSKLVDCNFLLLSYRGYGKSSGSANEAGLKLDAHAALDYVASTLPDTRIILFGQSLGGAVAIYLGCSYPHLIHSIIVENTFLSITKLIPTVMPWLGWARHLCTERWDSESLLRSHKEPIRILFLAGLKDRLVPPQHMKQLYSMAINIGGNSKYFSFKHGDHNDTCLQDGYYEAIKEFITKS